MTADTAPSTTPDASAQSSAQRVQDWLHSKGHPHPVRTLADSTRTAQEAADALGCTVEQIAKSIVFRDSSDDTHVLVVASGGNRVDVEKVAELIGSPLGKANATFVRQCTGYAIGGVPPVAHLCPPVVVIDEDLLTLPHLFAAGGTPHSIFQLTAQDLVAWTGGVVGDIREGH